MEHMQDRESALAHSNEGARRAAQRLSSGSARPSKLRCGFSLLLSAALAASFSSALPALAYAASTSAVDEAIEQAADATTGTEVSATSYATDDAEGVAEASNTALKSKYDLRDPNGDGDTSDSVVTSVKNQSPWGTCWGFSAIAACETSIISEAAAMGKGNKYKNINLSELELAQYVYKDGGTPEDAVIDSQVGEGYHAGSKDPNAALNKGGLMEYAGNLFASGVGPLDETFAGSYQNKEGVIYCMVTPAGSTKMQYEYLTEDQITLRQASGATVTKCWWAGNYKDSSGNMVYTDWTLSNEDWNSNSYEFENAYSLPDTRVLNADKTWKGIDERAIEDIKGQIQNYGRAVSCAFYADTSLPDQTTGAAKYINSTNWAHYTNNTKTGINHGVTIIGWDDDYEASKFAEGFSDKAAHTPEGNGAWLVKNSWGSEEESFPNGQPKTKFGIENEKGEHTGYFWISYYDQSICMFETFDFDLNKYSSNTEYVIDQYDYMPQASLMAIPDTTETQNANVFTAQYGQILRTLSFYVARPNTTVSYKVYLLDENAKDPTDGELVCQGQDNFDYAGYKRVTMDKEDWVPLREGQKFSVVLSQLCNDDGLYYTCAGMNSGKPTTKQITTYSNSQRIVVINSLYNSHYSELVDKYESAGMAEKEAKLKAQTETKAWFKTAEAASAIQKQLNEDVTAYSNTYWVAKVNEGESYSNSATAGAQYASAGSSWFGWEELANDKALSTRGVVVDNLPIKGISELTEWASIEQLSKIEKLIATAKATIENATISTDGSDVAGDKTWLTQEQKDQLSEAITKGEEALANAGADYKTKLIATTPTSSDADAVITSLSVTPSNGYIKVANTIKAAKSKVTVKKGKTAKVAINNAQGKVTVTCSNKKATASCKSGKLVIKGKTKGTAVITVKAKGNNSYKAGSVKVKVTVK